MPADSTTIAARIPALRQARATVLVVVDGLGGSGKTTLAESVSRELAAAGLPVTVVHGDDFYLPSQRRMIAEDRYVAEHRPSERADVVTSGVTGAIIGVRSPLD